ncbi:periplasmic heavy metal sensor [Corallococcus sp. M34]|uniref:Spy/CpxP family protein refolding chaperone n=1 Tax=Citreicoccus inhibens TaxID=2849499 RepID=UPI001C238653|nr:periplasmic heavy metal sensor [Citreicoccus inhibens]MBU8898315.1 periplasmic heavy metal sensor [Citreicoccus inhibens]
MFGFVFGTACLAGLFATVRRGFHHRWHSHHPFGHGDRRGFGWRLRLRWLFERLDATPGQEKVIAQAADDVFEAFGKARTVLGDSRSTVAQAMRGEQFDGAAVRELFSRQDIALEEVRRTVQGALAQVHEALEPHQRRELADLMERGWHHGWRGHPPGRCGWRGRGHHPGSHFDDARPPMY